MKLENFSKVNKNPFRQFCYDFFRHEDATNENEAEDFFKSASCWNPTFFGMTGGGGKEKKEAN
jgi:hypothetical protein